MSMATCPVCGREFPQRHIARHVDQCLAMQQSGGEPHHHHPRRASSGSSGGDGGRTALDLLRAAQATRSLNVQGFLELLMRSSSGGASSVGTLQADGIIQVCVWAVDSAPRCRKLVEDCVVVAFEGEEITVPLLAGTAVAAAEEGDGSKRWTCAAKTPRTASFVVTHFYGPSPITLTLGGAGVNGGRGRGGSCCFPGSSRPASSSRIRVATVSLRDAQRGAKAEGTSVSLAMVTPGPVVGGHEDSGGQGGVSSESMMRDRAALDAGKKVISIRPSAAKPDHARDGASAATQPALPPVRVHVWFRYLPSSGPHKHLLQLFERSVCVGDSTTAGILCRFQGIRAVLKSQAGLSLLERVLAGWTSGNGTAEGGGAGAAAAADADADADAGNGGGGTRAHDGNAFKNDARAALCIMLQEMKRGGGLDGPMFRTEAVTAATLLHFAASVSADSATVAEEIHRVAPEALDKTTDPEGRTPFLLACALGKVHFATFLATQGIRISRRPVTARNGDTALILAARNGKLEVVQWLLGKEADPNLPNSHDETPLSVAVGFRHDSVAANIARCLIGAGSEISCRVGERTLHTAAIAGNAETMRVLVKAAALHTKRSAAELLALYNAELDATPFDLVARGSSAGHRNMQVWMRTLLAQGPDPDDARLPHQWEGVVKGPRGVREITLVGAWGPRVFDARRVLGTRPVTTETVGAKDADGASSWPLSSPSASPTDVGVAVPAGQKDSGGGDSDASASDDGTVPDANELQQGGVEQVGAGAAQEAESTCAYSSVRIAGVQALFDVMCVEFAAVAAIPRTPVEPIALYLEQHNWDVAAALRRWTEPSGVPPSLPVGGVTFHASSMPASVPAEAEEKQTAASASICLICGESQAELGNIPMASLNACGHMFCSDCWKGYVQTFINSSGAQQVSFGSCISCPHHACSAGIDLRTLQRLGGDDDGDKETGGADDADKTEAVAAAAAIAVSAMSANTVQQQQQKKRNRERIRYRIAQAFVAQKKDVARFCPTAGCGAMVLWRNRSAVSEPRGHGCAVQCCNGHDFCFWCGSESHGPATCAAWAEFQERRNMDQALLAKWLMENTKLCPKCNERVEKAEGCKHITCKCGHEFCWDCKRPWADHDETTGGFFRCIFFDPTQDYESHHTGDPSAGGRGGAGAAKTAAEEEEKDSDGDVRFERFTFHLKRFTAREDDEQRAKKLCDMFFETLRANDGGAPTAAAAGGGWRAGGRGVLRSLGFYFGKKNSERLLHRRMQSLVDHFRRAELASGALLVPTTTAAATGGETKVEVPVLMEQKVELGAEEKKKEKKKKPVVLGSEGSSSRAVLTKMYGAALRELVAFFRTAKYCYVALFGAQDNPQTALVRYHLGETEVKAHQLRTLLRPRRPGKIIEQRRAIAGLTASLAQARAHLSSVSLETPT